MSDFDYFTIVEHFHTFQNPTSEEKLDRLVTYLDLSEGARVLDVGCGKAWLLRRMAERHRIEGVGLEIRRSFLDEGKGHIERSPGLGKLTLVHGPAAGYAGRAGTFDIALCIGASFAIGAFEDLVGWLKPFVRTGGTVAIGDVYTKGPARRPVPAHFFSGGAIRSLGDTVDVLEAAGLPLVGLIESSTDEWDRYESLHWQASDRWLRENPHHPERDAFRAQARADQHEYLTEIRDVLGWAIFVCRVA
jgi:cyclopropane fatty-acyl-phospholipid synthase-like methyltransferase